MMTLPTCATAPPAVSSVLAVSSVVPVRTPPIANTPVTVSFVPLPVTAIGPNARLTLLAARLPEERVREEAFDAVPMTSGPVAYAPPMMTLPFTLMLADTPLPLIVAGPINVTSSVAAGRPVGVQFVPLPQVPEATPTQVLVAIVRSRFRDRHARTPVELPAL